MEAVRAFNNELSSLYESRPPVSRAKMAQVTKNAIKAIKFYKHVVQSVEKFIQKCKPEYKVPGLYVIDSIVRQSRHQFGPEKDVFSPRFTKNIVNTFTNLFKCPVEERSRVVRVLNLWQKNSVFPMEVIQPLLDLAADPTNPELVAAASRSVEAVVSVTQKVPLPGPHTGSNGGDSSGSSQILQQTEMLSTITKLLQQAQEGSITASAHDSQLQQLQHLQQQLVMQTERISKPQQIAPPIDSNLLAQIQVLTNQLLTKTGEADSSGDAGKPTKPSEPGFNKKLLDFDYGDSDEDDDRQDHHHHHHHHQQPPPQQPQMQRQPLLMQPHGDLGAMLQNPNLVHQIQQMSQQQEELQSEIGAQEQLRRRLLEQQQQQFDREIGQSALMGQQPPMGFPGQDMGRGQDEQEEGRDNQDSRDRGDRRRNRSRDRSRSPRRRRRSRSRSKDRRRRSRSRDRHRRSRSRERENNRRDREKERERRKKGLPTVKDNHISICTTTLWFGHLTKHTTEEELREHIEKYGTIKTINMIPPRGCAFVCLTKRKDAFKALDRLKGVKVNGNALKVAWAPGIGVKESMFKDLWDVEQGTTFIPWEHLPQDITSLVAGGMVDEDSLPDRLKGMKSGEEDGEDQAQGQGQDKGMEGGTDVGRPPSENMMSMQPGMAMGMPPNQPPNFPGPMQGQGSMNMMGPGGPMGMMGGPSMGMRPGGPGPMGGPNMGGMPAMGGPQQNMPGMRPGQMNMGSQGPMIRGPGSQMGGPRPMGGPGSHLDGPPPQLGMNLNNSRAPFPPFPPGGMPPRFPQMGNVQPPFFNRDNNGGNDHQGLGDSDMRGGVAEPKEWPPDDEMNDEDDEPDEDMMDSDERMMPPGPQRHLPPGVAGLRMGGPFGPRGPMVPGQNPAAMLAAAMSRGQSPNAAVQSLLSLRMMTAGQRQPMLTVPGGPSGPGFALAQRMASAGMRLSMPGVGVRPGMVGGGPSSQLLTPSTGASLPVTVSVNGSIVVTGAPPGIPTSSGPPRMTLGGGPASPGSPKSDDQPDEDSPHNVAGGPPSSGPLPLMQLQGGNRPPPPGPILGRGFSPMTIRPRGGPGLLGLRPGPPGAGFNRFGGPRPLLGGSFGGRERPHFGGRFGGPFRPPVGFLDQDEREDKDERMLPRFDLDDGPLSRDMDEHGPPKDRDERGAQEKTENKDMDERVDIDERSNKSQRPSGRPSRWSVAENVQSAPAQPEPVVSAPVKNPEPAFGAPAVSAAPTEEASQGDRAVPLTEGGADRSAEEAQQPAVQEELPPPQQTEECAPVVVPAEAKEAPDGAKEGSAEAV